MFSSYQIFLFLRINTDIVSEEESDDFTDEEEEELQQTTPTVSRHTSVCDNQLYNSIKQQESDMSNSQWYIDLPKNDQLESLTSQLAIGNRLKLGF